LHENSLSIDGSGGRKAALALAMKNYGPDDGLYARWTPEKRRAYGGVYRYHALSLIMRERDWLAATPYVQLAFLADPDLARDIDFYYELALGYQPEGRRGLADDPLSGDRTLILEDNSRQVEALLGRVFQPSQGAELQRLRADASASAWHALGIAAYNTGHLGLARRWLGRALAARPGLAGKPGVVAAFAKSLLGGELLTALRRLKNAVRKAVARRPAAHSTRTV
jgi:tetratricopeptide (TPR) repeat protein